MTSAESTNDAAPVARGAGGGVAGLTRVSTGSDGARGAAAAGGVTTTPAGAATTGAGGWLTVATVVVVSAETGAARRSRFAFRPSR